MVRLVPQLALGMPVRGSREPGLETDLGASREHAVRQAQPPTEEQPFKCKCGDDQCENEWHRLAMWLGEDPVNNYRRLLAYMEEQVAGSAGDDGGQHES